MLFPLISPSELNNTAKPRDRLLHSLCSGIKAEQTWQQCCDCKKKDGRTLRYAIRQKEVFHHTVRHVGLLILGVPTGKNVNKLLIRQLVEMSCMQLSAGGKIHTLCSEIKHPEYSDRLSPRLSICSGCGKDLEPPPVMDWFDAM